MHQGRLHAESLVRTPIGSLGPDAMHSVFLTRVERGQVTLPDSANPRRDFTIVAFAT